MDNDSSCRSPIEFDVEILEQRQLLSTSSDSGDWEILIRAAGTTNTETIELQINEQTVATYNNIGGNALQSEFVVMRYQASSQIEIDEVRIVFVNNGLDAEGVDRNVRIDQISLNGAIYETESPEVYSNATWVRNIGFVEGFVESEFLHRNGYFRFDIEPAASTVIEIHASGDQGGERFELIVDGTKVFSDDVTRQFRTYSYATARSVELEHIKIAFTNDRYDPDQGIDTNLNVAWISVDGDRTYTNEPTVYSTSTWTTADGIRPGYGRGITLHSNGYFRFGPEDSIEDEYPIPFPPISEGPSGTYDIDIDPTVGAVVTAFIDNNPDNPNDTYDIQSNWIQAVDELASIGFKEVTFAVYRNVTNGYLVGGPRTAVVGAATQHAIDQGMSVTILPVFEANGWRGDYDPTGIERERFQNHYTAWIANLARIRGVDRFSIGSELNRMVRNRNNVDFFVSLIETAQNSFEIANNTTGRIGYAANFDSYSDSRHRALFSRPGIEYIGISAYQSAIKPSQASLVSDTGPVSSEAFIEMVKNWNRELDRLENFSRSMRLPIVIQEAGSVQQNYASVAPFAVNPSDWVSSQLPNRHQNDPLEQRAVYESLIHALDGRKQDFESVTFWTWEHGASRGRRTFEALGTTGVEERFAIWPTDGGGGQYLSQYVATVEHPQNRSLQVFARGTTGDESFDVVVNREVVATIENTGTESGTFEFIVDAKNVADIQIVFTNDFLDLENGINRTLFVDGIRLDDVDYRADSENTFVSGTYIKDVGITKGFLQTGSIHTNGYILFNDDIENSTRSTIDVVAYGVSGQELLEVVVNGNVVKTLNIAKKESVYRIQLDQRIRKHDVVQVYFINDFADIANNIHYAINVDKLIVDGEDYETENPSTFGTGTWVREIGFVEGNVESEWLHRNGYFRFEI